MDNPSVCGRVWLLPASTAHGRRCSGPARDPHGRLARPAAASGRRPEHEPLEIISVQALFFFFFLLKEKVSSDFQMEMQFSYRDWLCQATSLQRSGP